MTLHPMLSALRKHKAGVALIALQIALTLAIVCNAVFIIGQRLDRIQRDTGMDEKNLILVAQQWMGAPDADSSAGLAKLDSMQLEDLAALRKLPDVASAAPINTLPLLDASHTGRVSLTPGVEARKDGALMSYYFGDEQVLSTLRVRLIAGRAFTAADVRHQSRDDQSAPTVVIITEALADGVFPGVNAVGRSMFMDGSTVPTTVVGVIERLQSPMNHNTAFIPWRAALVPFRIDADAVRYVVRAKPGRMESAMRQIAPALYAVNRKRVIDDNSVRSFATIRAKAYRADVGMALLMGVVCVTLLAITAAGIVGLTSFWVGQRHRQIGVRRALGARKVDILRYFQIENLMIAGAGVVIGLVLAVVLNLWLMKNFEMQRMPVAYAIAGMVSVMLLGQAAVFVPARRASNVSPIAATRAL